MNPWQSTMIALARSAAVTHFMQERAPTSKLAARFVAGPDVAAFIAKAQELRGRNIATSAFFLGEYVDDPAKVAINVEGIRAVIAAIDGEEVDLHVSVDPSQVGYAVDPALGEANTLAIAEALAARSAPGRKTLMLDMEDESYVPVTLDLHAKLCEAGLPAAVTIQAYLLRSSADIEALIERGAMVRLVKGAFVGSSKTALTNRMHIDGSYRALAYRMLMPKAREAGVRPVFGTHDEAIIHGIIGMARANGWQPGEYEFEMLYGVRPALQRRMIDRGEALRLYLPFGRDWWPYAVRRVGEGPRNAWLVAKALVSRQ